MGISDLPGHRARIAIAFLLAAALGIGGATTWAKCQPYANGSSYIWIPLYASLLGLVLYGAAMVPAVLSGGTRPVMTWAIGCVLAVTIALIAWGLMFGPDAGFCRGDKWGP